MLFRLLSTYLVALLGACLVEAQNLRALLVDQGYNVSIVLPGEPGYANYSQPFNLRYTFKPAGIAFPSNAQEVAELVKFGQAVNHTIAPRSGGHSYIANGLGGQDGVIVVDLRNFRRIDVDEKTGAAVIGTGNKLGNIATALNSHGRALPHGTCAYVGIGGHAAYGGFGFTSRMWGLTLDTIESYEVVTANGTVTTVSQNSDPDLFWAMRGAAGSFGITTAITFRTFPAPPEATIFSYNWHLTSSGAASFLLAFQEFVLSGNLPPEFGPEIVLTSADIRGNVSVGLAGGWYKPLAGLNATLAPFFAKVPPPRERNFDTGDYLHSAENLAGGSLDTPTKPDGTDTFYAKSLMTPTKQPMTKKAIQALMDVVSTEGFDTSVDWFFQIELFGGHGSAVNAVKPRDTAFFRRDSLFTIQFYASSSGNVPPYPNAGFRFLDNVVNAITNNLPSDWDYGAYMNYPDDRLVDGHTRYYGENYPRLQRLKAAYDPKGIFSFPTGIQA